MLRSCLIIGAGMAGITAASELRRAGLDVSVLEKSHGPGGRMATRPFAGGIFDYGAQFFTVRSVQFQQQVQTWLDRQIARVWSHGFATLTTSGPTTTSYSPDGHPRYCGVNGMNSVVKYLADEASSIGVRLIFDTKVSRLTSIESSWTLETEDTFYSADSVIISAPIPQSLNLLNSNLPIQEPSLKNLTGVSYDRCLSLLVQSDDSLSMPAPGAIAENRPGQPLSFLSDNSQKNISPIPGSLTIHSSAEMADKLYREKDEEIAEQLISCAQTILGRFKVHAWYLHRWRYSKPSHTPSVDGTTDGHSMICSQPAPLVIAGEALSGAKVEGAFLSGLSAAKAVLGLS